MIETWKEALEEGLIVGVLLIDFRKAFDTINHNILEKKLQGCGIAGQTFDNLCDYLNDRTQYVELNGVKSKTIVIGYGVPQGSLLGPRLFTIYINDLPDSIHQGYVFLFVDDTTFYYVGRYIGEVIDMLNNIGGQVSEWCKRNQLTMHTGKSEAMIITRQDFIGPLRPAMIGNEIIKYVSKATSLGIEIDNHLRWESQVKKVTKSFSTKVGQLRKISYLPIKVKEEIYFKTVTVTYGTIVWGTCSPSLMKDIERIHVRAAKIIHRSPKHISDEDVLEAAKWDKIEYIYKRKVLSKMHKIFCGECPEVLRSYFTQDNKRDKEHKRFTVPRCTKEIGRTSIKYRGRLLWNSLPLNNRSIEKFHTFKKRLKKAKESMESVSFLKEASMITFKRTDYVCF